MLNVGFFCGAHITTSSTTCYYYVVQIFALLETLSSSSHSLHCTQHKSTFVLYSKGPPNRQTTKFLLFLTMATRTIPPPQQQHQAVVGRKTPQAGSRRHSAGDAMELLKAQKNYHHKIKKSVWFDCIEIIEFPVELGDHPCANGGAPLCIGWESQNRESFEVDYYEVYRDERRQRWELSLSGGQRTQLLLEQGYTMKEIESTVQACEKIRLNRELSSRQGKKWDRFHIVMEKGSKTLKKIVGSSSSKKSPTEQHTVQARSA